MMEYLEIVLIGVIVFFQYKFFRTTKASIQSLMHIIPSLGKVKTTFYEDTEARFDEYVLGETEQNEDDELVHSPIVKLTLIESENGSSSEFKEIQAGLNKYLFRNRHSTAEFNLMRDIVERNIDAVESNVNSTISVPLYLGLMGSIVGIILGVFNMAGAVEVENIDIKPLLTSVGIAMIASLLGLLLSVINSASHLKKAKAVLEANKNAFYTLLQVDLLPTLNQGMQGTFASLQRNLSAFNEKFDTNLDRLNSVFDSNYQAIKMQKDLLDALDNSKIADITKYNLKVLKEMSSSLEHFQQFNTIFNNLNSFLSNSYQLVDKTNEFLERTDAVKQIAEKIEGNMAQSNLVLKFLSDNLQNMDSYQSSVNQKLVEVGNDIAKVFEAVRETLQTTCGDIGNEITKRNDSIAKLLTEQHESFDTNLNRRNEDAESVLANFYEHFGAFFQEQSDAVNKMVQERGTSLDSLKYLQDLVPVLAELKQSLQGGRSGNFNVGKVSEQLQSVQEVVKRLDEDAQVPLYKKILKGRVPAKTGEPSTNVESLSEVEIEENHV